MPLLGATGGGSAKGFGALANLGYLIRNSLRFRSSASAYLSRTPASAGNRQIMTYSFWVKRGAITGDYNLTNATTDASNSATLYFNSSNSQSFDVFLKVGGTNYSVTTSQVFRDPSAWYHIVVAIDTTQATSSNRTKVYVNGSQVTNLLSASYVPQNSNLALNNNVAQYIGYSNYFDGYMAEVNFIDGQALTPSSFGKTDAATGQWIPKKFAGTYGTNGYYLKFSDIATTSGSNAGLGKDFSGNGNYFNTNNISVTSGVTYDAMIDSPTNASSSGTQPVGNYAVLNPLNKATNDTISNANLLFTGGTSGSIGFCPATIAVSSGKYYWEVTYVNAGGVAGEYVGIVTTTTQNSGNYGAGQFAGGYDYNLRTGNKYNNGTSTAYGASCTTNDVIGVALDLDAGTLTFYKNNTSQGTAFTGLSGTFTPEVGHDGYQAATFATNFGQRPFAYTPPTGYKALCTTNLPTPTILQGNKYMDATIYTGDGTYPRSITNTAGFKPDLVWTKARSTTYSNVLYDSVRGTGTGAALFSDLTAAEGSNSGNVNLTAFNSNGWSVGSTSTTNIMNNSGTTFVGWQWQAGQGTNSTNTSGSITSTVSVSTTAGFSVVTYTGTGANATVGHGLGVAPKMVIVKSRTTAGNEWCVWHTSLTNATYYLYLNGTAAQAVDTTFWNSTAPTSTVINLGSNTRTNQNTANLVAYCFAEIAGFSAFGSYTGNGSADGPFVFTGFRPKFILTKRTNGAGDDWTLFDTARNTYNLSTLLLRPNSTIAEQSSSIDILSNGFKWRQGGGNGNETSGTYIYMAFAENPFKNANAR